MGFRALSTECFKYPQLNITFHKNKGHELLKIMSNSSMILLFFSQFIPWDLQNFNIVGTYIFCKLKYPNTALDY